MKVADGYGLWSDEELFTHREACIREARVQERWGDHQTQMYAKRSGGVFTRGLGLPPLSGPLTGRFRGLPVCRTLADSRGFPPFLAPWRARGLPDGPTVAPGPKNGL